ncbi:hypothetical protein J2W88_000090 [Acidovorax delafieldii]|uniref:Transmembrane protein n=1 Tax=Acidovorax delafieldii TaxID=47920 RepID=A0AAJ2BV35_ACIDE|nr:hypothetical protein [Acidovorax delafieldii]MDR6764832.1 hypothetical protein [Acidovorax delafieldii]MDR6835269.1 hypothetical protein [Acidovorax delafieldii]MDR7365761.1 hypothetical protein [Acidovorax delafieldii]
MKALVMDLVLFGALFAWCAGSGQVTVRRAAGALAASGVCLVSAWLVGLYGGNTLAQVFLFDGPQVDGRFGALWGYSWAFFSLLCGVHLLTQQRRLRTVNRP